VSKDKSRPWASLFGDKPIQKGPSDQGRLFLKDAVAPLADKPGAGVVNVSGKAAASVISGDTRSPDHLDVLAKNQFGSQRPQVGNDPNIVGTRYIANPTINQVYSGTNTPAARASPVKPEIQP
jgi:hypothetical protein